MTTLSERIKQLRKEKDLTQEEFGKIFGIVKSTVSLYENNKSTPDDEIKKKIAEYFNVSLDYLMGNSDIRNPYANKIPKMTPHEKIDYDDFMEQAKIHFMGASSEDKDAIFKDLSELYFESKEINRKKFNPKKNKQ